MTHLEILKTARDLISDPKNWASKWYAYDNSGKTVEPESPRACRWCACGAIRKAGNLNDSTAQDLYLTVYPEPYAACLAGMDLIDFNDNHTHHEVLALFDKAISTLEVK